MAKRSKTTATTAQTATTTPTNAPWVDAGLASMGGAISQLGSQDPKSFVAGPDPLQTQAAQGAAALTTSPYFAQAGNMFTQAAGGGANTYNPTGYTAGSYTGQGYDPTKYQAQGYTGQGYTGQGYTGQGYNAEGYTAAQGAADGYTAQTGKASSLLDNLQSYMSPYTGQVVDAALADYDYGAGQSLAQQKLDERRNGAFGDSGLAISRSQTTDALTRGRGSLSAGLRDQAFNTGANLSNLDAGRRQEMDVTNLGALNSASQFNTGQKNAMTATNLAAVNSASQFNTGARNDAAGFLADALNTSGQFNANANNNASQFNANANNNALQFTAGANNTAGQFNAGAVNDAASFGANANNAASQFNVGAQNTAGQFNAAAQNTAGQFNAGQQDSYLKRMLDAASGMSSLGTAQGNDYRSNIGLQGDLGSMLQAIAQNQAGAPLSVLSQLSSMWGTLPLNLQNGSTTNSTGNSTSKTKEFGLSGEDLGKLATAAAVMSARRPSRPRQRPERPHNARAGAVALRPRGVVRVDLLSMRA